MKKARLMMQAIVLSFVVCAFLLAGCESTLVSGSQDEASIDNSIPAMSSLNDIKMVPFKGTYSGSGGLDDTRTDCPEETLPISGTGSGVASHLGKIDVYFSQCSYGALDPTNPTYLDGYFIMTAANGDEVHGAYYGTATGLDTFIDYVTITNGTGRFENISGTATDYGTATFTTDGFDYEINFEGIISSVGSSK